VNQPAPAAPIVVGIDGSRAGLDAALWAAEEALSIGAPLRLVHAILVADDDGPEFDVDPEFDDAPVEPERAHPEPETDCGRASLRGARAALLATGKPLTVETEILWGDVDALLIEESRHATLVCVGSVGIGPLRHRTLGSTAAELAEHAHSPVAVIGSPHTSTGEPDWIVAVVADIASSDAILDTALHEAYLRRAPVLALGISRSDDSGVHYDELARRVDGWRRTHPHLHVHPVAVPTDVATFLRQHRELSVQLTVLGAGDAEQTAAIVGPRDHNDPRRNRSSVLVVR
jgi:nucleotide-binding universal stress UspA family protein